MTDRVSAEALREAIDAALHELGEPGPGYPAPVANAVDILRAALRDTRPDGGIEHALHYDPSCEECAYLARPVMLPRPDSGIDAAALAEALSDFRREREQHATAPWATDEAVTGILARLSTPRTETSE